MLLISINKEMRMPLNDLKETGKLYWKIFGKLDKLSKKSADVQVLNEISEIKKLLEKIPGAIMKDTGFGRHMQPW
jgi:hypothetical protein